MDIKVEWFDRGTDRIERETFTSVSQAIEFGEELRNRDPLGEYLVGDLTPYTLSDDGSVFELIKLH